jgi:gliding motility-associated-like protein
MYFQKIFALALFACLFSWTPNEVAAQDVIPTKGKEFWVGFMQNYEVEAWQEELNLFIVSDQNTTGLVEIPGQGWSQAFAVIANQTTTVTIPNNIGENYLNETIDTKGIYVTTEDTVAVFAINFNGYTADGTKVLPIQSLGVEYRISSYQGLSSWGSEFLIVATEDDTEVEITPTVATLGGQPAGVPFTVSLNVGETYQVKVSSAGGDFMGTVIKGTENNGECRPFAVFSGTSCTNIPVGCVACDHIYEQNFPVETWGTEFYVVPFSFATSYTYRVMANVNNTNVVINGGAPILLNAGEFFEDNDVSDVICVIGDRPISVTQYMEGISCAGSGDPAMLILNDATQKIDNITFSTVSSTVITEHGLNVIMETADVGSLALDGAAVPASEFNVVANCPSHSYAQITIAQGSHTLDAPNGFTAYVYGTGSAESYSYSVGSFSPLPPIQVDSVLCTSDTVNIAVTSGLLDIYWYAETNPDDTLATGPQLTLIPPIISDIYVGVGNHFQSGCIEEEYFSVEVPEPPGLTMTQSETEICQYQNVQLGVIVDPPSDIYEYTWVPNTGLDDANIANPIATPLESTWYSVLVSTPSGCGSNIDSLYIEVVDGNITSFEASTDIIQFCAGGDAQLEADLQESVFEDNFDPGVSWGLWSDVQNGADSDVCGSASGLALYFNGAGQRSAATIDMDVSNGGSVQFALKIANGAAPCDNADLGEDVVLEYSTAGGGGPWTIINTYYESQYPSFTDISVDIPILAQTAATRFRWRQLANSGNNQDNWCLDNIYIGSHNETDYTFSWTPNYNLDDDGIFNPLASPLLDTTYYVSVFDPLTGCTYVDSVFLDVGQPFDLELTPDTVLCDVQGIQLNVTPTGSDSYSYLWSPDDGTISNIYSSSPVVSPSSTTTYSVAVESDQGCSNSGDVEVIVNQLLNLDVATDNNNFCAGETANLSALLAGDPAELTYEWTPGQFLDDPTSQYPVASPISDVTFVVVVTDVQSGCVLSDFVDINVYDAFIVTANADQELCDVIGFQLDAEAQTNDFLSWQWTPATSVANPNLPNTTITVDGSDQFIVTATSAAGCTSTDTVNVTVLFESFDLGPDIDICIGEVSTLSTGYDATYDHSWSTNENTPTIDVNTSGIYTVTVTSIQGCEDTDNVSVTVHDLPVVDLGIDPGLCEGEVHPLDAGNPGSDYDWSTEQTAQTINVTQSGTYSVEVIDGFGCINSDDILLTFHTNPVLNLPADTTICEDQFIVLDAENTGSLFNWSNNAGTQTITVNQAGVYSVEVTNTDNCTSTDQTILSVATYPTVNLGPDAAFCQGEMATLNAGNAGLNFNWSTLETTQTIDVTTSGVYSVTVDNDYCFIGDQVSIVFNPLPVDNLFSDSIFCFSAPPYEVILNAGNPGATYFWNNGSTSNAIAVNGPGYFDVTVVTPFGCSLTFDVFINEVCYGDFLYVPNAFTPDHDGINDVLRAVGQNVADFHFEIWNRWGDLVFTSEDINEPWDGSYQNGEYYVDSEVYIYVLEYKYYMDVEGTISDWVVRKGHITLIR